MAVYSPVLITVKILVGLSLLCAVLALGYQVLAAWGGGHEDYSKRAGSSARGIAYSFTVAMMPRHKESVSRHPGVFAVGVVMHIGVILSLLGVVLLLVSPRLGYAALSLGRPLIALSLAAGLYLLIRRVLSEDLRAMSAPDDYIAILATCGLLALASVYPSAASDVLYLIYAALLFAYLPLGKLRHAVFFFVARGDHGRRLGRRGVYPPATARTA
jgi:nitrate reductase gamma subunit